MCVCLCVCVCGERDCLLRERTGSNCQWTIYTLFVELDPGCGLDSVHVSGSVVCVCVCACMCYATVCSESFLRILQLGTIRMQWRIMSPLQRTLAVIRCLFKAWGRSEYSLFALYASPASKNISTFLSFTILGHSASLFFFVVVKNLTKQTTLHVRRVKWTFVGGLINCMSAWYYLVCDWVFKYQVTYWLTCLSCGILLC